MKYALLALVFIGISTTQAFAVEANMCVSVTDVCCDANFSSVDFTLPGGQQVTTTYVYHNGSSVNKVYIECWDIVNGQENFLIFTLDDVCGCQEGSSISNHPISWDHHIRFKVKCKDCEGGNCAIGSSTVYLYSSAAQASCPIKCEDQ